MTLKVPKIYSDDKTKYKILFGNLSVKDPKTNNRTLYTPESDPIPLSHLSPEDRYFLAEGRKQIAPV